MFRLLVGVGGDLVRLGFRFQNLVYGVLDHFSLRVIDNFSVTYGYAVHIASVKPTYRSALWAEYRSVQRTEYRSLEEIERPLFRSEQSVAGVAQTGDDVAVLVQSFVQRGGVDGHVGVRFVEGGYAFGRGDQAHKLNVFDPSLFDEVDRHSGASAGSEHRVDDEQSHPLYTRH